MVADALSRKTSAKLHASYDCHGLFLDDSWSTGVKLGMEDKEEALLVNFQVRPNFSGLCA